MKKIIWVITLFVFFSFGPLEIFAAKSAELIPLLAAQIKKIQNPPFSKKDAIKELKKYIGKETPELTKGLQMILLPQEDQNTIKQNYALELFLYLLTQKAYREDDPITIALALANNYLYSVADKEAKKAILRDSMAHYRYYLKILDWQKKVLSIKYELSKVPLIPKIYWAYRVRGMDRLKKGQALTLNHYQEFVDSIANLEKMHDMVKKLNLSQYESLVNLAQNLEFFARSGEQLEYRCDIDCVKNRLSKDPDDKNLQNALKEYERGEYETFYYGKKRRWDHFAWLNYQLKRYENQGKFRGDCVTITTIQSNLYKAAGIPSFSNQIYSINPKFYHHNSPYFYNPYFKRWNSVQGPVEDEKGYYNYFDIPIWHHYIYEKYGRNQKTLSWKEIQDNFWRGESASYQQVIHFRKRGFEDAHFEEFFLSMKTLEKGIIYNSKTAPAKLSDQDGDGILDDFESFYATNPGKADSDGDGISDLYEIEKGSEPLKASVRPSGEVFLDGLSQFEVEKHKITLRTSPAGDAKANGQIFDVAFIGAKKIEDFVYVAVGFHNDITANKRDTHTLRITSVPDGRHYFVQIQDGRTNLYHFTEKNGKRELEHSGRWNFPLGRLNQVEIQVPLKHFKDSKALIVYYQASGVLDGKGTNGADYSSPIRVALEEPDRAKLMGQIPWQHDIADPKGDYQGHTENRDLRRLKAAIVRDKLYVLAEFEENMEELPIQIQSIDFNGAQRVFFQTWGLDFINRYIDKEKVRLVVSDFRILEEGKRILYEIDLKDIPKGKYKLRYRVGAKKENGENEINSDLSEYVELNY